MLLIIINKLSRDYYTIDFPFNKELIDNIKKLDKREFLKDKKLWKLDSYNLYQLITQYRDRGDIFFEFNDPNEKPLFIEKYKKALVKVKTKEEIKTTVLNKQKDAKDLKLKLTTSETIDFDESKYLKEGIKCFKHQVIGALYSNAMSSLIVAADLGTGKSLLSLLASEINEDIKKVLIIVPNSLKFNWGMEISKFTNQKYYILNEKKKSTNIYTPEEAKYFIVNYEYFSGQFSFKERIKKYGIDTPDRIIVDEAHRLKNPKAGSTRNILDSFKDDVDSWLLLTGTPVPNKLAELFVPLQIISPIEFTSKSKFYTEYCGMVYNPHSFSGWVQTDNVDLDKLHNKLDDLMYRVRKKDVLQDLPEIQINKIYLKLTDQEEKEYKSIEDGLKTIDWSNPSILFEKEAGSDISVMGIMTKLRQYNSMVKLKHVKNFITELNEEGNKVVIFDCYVNPLKQLVEEFKNNSEIFYGGIKEVSVRQDIINRFQEDNNKLMNLCATSQAGNYGITLTQASNMIMLTQDYVPSTNSQCYARIHRIGQTKPVSIYIFIIKDTIDEDVDLLISSKLKIINKVVDNEEYVDSTEKSVISELVQKYKSKFI